MFVLPPVLDHQVGTGHRAQGTGLDGEAPSAQAGALEEEEPETTLCVSTTVTGNPEVRGGCPEEMTFKLRWNGDNIPSRD